MDHDPSHTSPQDCTVLVIGAGIAGVAVAVNLQQRGIHNFVVLEMGGGVGGTWWDNRYPGAEVDVTSELYSFSFAPHVFTRTHAGQEEIRAYIEDVVVSRNLMDRFRFSVKVGSVVWDERTQTWHVTSADGEQWRAEHVVSCVGQLNNPRYPDWPGLGDFQGPCFHTARWDSSVDLTGQRVAVIGTGSTSAQLVPPVAEVARHVYLFQRQPGWVIPKPDRDYTDEEAERLRQSGWRLRLRRFYAFMRLERMRAVARDGTRANRRMQRLAEDYLRTAVPDESLRALLTPDYPYFGKRPVLTQYFYPALARPNVTLVPKAVTALTRAAVVAADGRETEVDVVVLATGFQPSKFLATLDVTGRHGQRLRDVWDTEPQAFLGMMAVGFPNFFVTYGPNTNGGTVMFTLERQAEWISDAISLSVRRSAVLDVRPSVVQRLDRALVQRNNDFVWSKTGNNYYTSVTGRVVTQWPFSQKAYWLLTRILRPSAVCVVTARNTSRAGQERYEPKAVAGGQEALDRVGRPDADPAVEPVGQP